MNWLVGKPLNTIITDIGNDLVIPFKTWCSIETIREQYGLTVEGMIGLCLIFDKLTYEAVPVFEFDISDQSGQFRNLVDLKLSSGFSITE